MHDPAPIKVSHGAGYLTNEVEHLWKANDDLVNGRLAGFAEKITEIVLDLDRNQHQRQCLSYFAIQS